MLFIELMREHRCMCEVKSAEFENKSLK